MVGTSDVKNRTRNINGSRSEELSLPETGGRENTRKDSGYTGESTYVDSGKELKVS